MHGSEIRATIAAFIVMMKRITPTPNKKVRGVKREQLPLPPLARHIPLLHLMLSGAEAVFPSSPLEASLVSCVRLRGFALPR